MFKYYNNCYNKVLKKTEIQFDISNYSWYARKNNGELHSLVPAVTQLNLM